MISQSQMKKQLARLMRLPYMPREPESLKGMADEFTRVLRGCCRSDVHCAMVVDAVMDAPRERVLSPGDIVETSRSVVSPDLIGPPGCNLCEGTGWFSFERPLTTPAGDYVADYADFCACLRGKWMRESEIQSESGSACQGDAQLR